MWCIGELNLAHERVDAGFTHGLVDTPEYPSMSPNGTVPKPRDGDGPPLWETGAILRYVANTYDTNNFGPVDHIGRAEVDKWTEWSKINIALNFTGPVFWRVVRTPPSKRMSAAIRAAPRMLDKFLDIAETRLSVFPYLAGEHFTLADIQFGYCLFRCFDSEIERAMRQILLQNHFRAIGTQD